MATTIEDAQRVHHYHDSDAASSGDEHDEPALNRPVDSGTGVNVRHFRLSDGGAVGRLPARTDLNFPDSDTLRPNMFQLLFRRFVSGDQGAWPLLIAESTAGGGLLGALQCQAQAPDGRWHLQYALCGEQLSHEDTVGIALIERAIVEAGKRGARRVMARIASDHPGGDVLRSCAFTAYSGETVFALPQVPAGTPSNLVNAQEHSDVWAVHQLYLHTTPREVQNAEALTSHEWEIDTEGRSRRGWFIADDGLMKAFVRVRTNRARHAIDLMYRPECTGQLPQLISSVCAVLAQTHPRRVFVSVRSYQQEAITVLHDLGFEAVADQVMMVRYTTSPAIHHMRASEAFERVRAAETDAQRAPSYYMRDAHE